MSFRENLGRLAVRAAAGMVAVAALASCGGGTYQESAFVPARILTFGDESNMLDTTDGLKYSINALSSSTDTLDCTLAPLWNQTLAAAYSLVYADCNVEAVADPQAFDETTLDATVDDLQTQVDAWVAGDSFNTNDLVTIWVGAHDVLNEYAANGSNDDVSTLTSDMESAGSQLASIVNQVAGYGAKVILLTIPDMGKTPYAYTENQRGDFDRASLLTQMSNAFNTSLRSNIVNDGSKIGLVLVDDFVDSAVRSPSSYGLLTNPNQTYGCVDTVSLPNCTDDTLNTDSSGNTTTRTQWLWADATHLGPTAHLQIGNQAVSRARSNPF